MNIYEAVFARKSVRNFRMDAISTPLVESITNYHRESIGLFGKTEAEVSLVDNHLGKQKILGLWGIRAPYYLLIYSEDGEKAVMNVGYVMQQTVLYICSRGLGSCIINPASAKRPLQTQGGKKLCGIIAFGRSTAGYARKSSEVKRLDMSKLCIYKEKPRLWMKQLLEAARIAPSSMNSQPWRFVVYDRRIHVFVKGKKIEEMKLLDELNLGIMFANMIVVAEELWLDVDLIRLEDISQKNFNNSRYILSVILRV